MPNLERRNAGRWFEITVHDSGHSSQKDREEKAVRRQRKKDSAFVPDCPWVFRSVPEAASLDGLSLQSEMLAQSDLRQSESPEDAGKSNQPIAQMYQGIASCYR